MSLVKRWSTDIICVVQCTNALHITVKQFKVGVVCRPVGNSNQPNLRTCDLPYWAQQAESKGKAISIPQILVLLWHTCITSCISIGWVLSEQDTLGITQTTVWHLFYYTQPHPHTGSGLKLQSCIVTTVKVHWLLLHCWQSCTIVVKPVVCKVRTQLFRW